MKISFRQIPRFLLLFLVASCIAVTGFGQQTSTTEGMMHYHEANLTLRAYSKAGKPKTEEGKKQLQSALEDLNKAIEVEPENALFWYVKGQVLDNLGLLPEALKAFQKSYAIKPQAQSAAGVGVVAAQLGKYKEAIQVLEAAIAGSRPNKATYSLMGNLVFNYLLNGQHQEAMKLAQSLRINNHTMYVQAVYTSTHAIANKRIEPPQNSADLLNTIRSFYDLALEFDPILKFLDGRRWEIGYEEENKSKYAREYYLYGENSKSWTELVIVQLLKDFSSDPAEFTKTIKDMTLKDCPDTKWKTLKVKNDPRPTSHFEWQSTEKCTKLGQQYETSKFIKIKEGLMARITYVSLGSGITKDQKSKWMRIIADSSLDHLHIGPGQKSK